MMNSFIKLFLFSQCILQVIANVGFKKQSFLLINNIFKIEGTFKADSNSESYETRIKKSIYTSAQFEWSSQIGYYCRYDVNKTLVQEALAILEKETCLRFHETLDFKNGGLRYVNGTNRCFSSLGKITDNFWQGIVIGRDCSYVMGVLHETLHALGVIHEMSRHDRDDYIDVKYENIKSGSQFNFDRYELIRALPYDLKYDFGSVMHYNRYITEPKSYFKSYGNALINS
uniref:Metalloendopeptidase n=1 Tax=Strongyloides papillosus TaxID=174720 RepID=A0A0N5BN18_STREA